jgi:hypothetical protein
MPTRYISEGLSLSENITGNIYCEGLSIGESFSTEILFIPDTYQAEPAGKPVLGVPAEVSRRSLRIGIARPGISWTRRFEPWPLGRDAIRRTISEQSSTISLSVSNIEWRRFLEYLRSGRNQGIPVRIWVGFADVGKKEANLALLYDGEINSTNFDEGAILIELEENIEVSLKEGLSRIYSAFCPFQFKSRQCGYVGPETTCDKSYSDCSARGNSRRFGGFKTLLEVQGRREII